MDSLQVKGIELITEEQKRELERIIAKHYEKIKRTIDNTFSLRVSIKEHSKHRENKEKRKKYSITIEISGEIPRIEASDEEWDFNKAVNRTFERLELEIEHKFHISDKFK